MTGPLFRKAESSFQTELGFPGSSLAREEEGAGHPLASAGRSRSPGHCSPPGSRTAPGSAHLCLPAAVQLANYPSAPVQGLTGGPRPVLSALHPSLRWATEPGLGRHPRGCSHKDATRALAKLPESSQAGEQTAEPEREPEAGVEGLWGCRKTWELRAEAAVGARGQRTGRRSAPRPPLGAHALQASGLGPRGPGACRGPGSGASGPGPSCRR